MEGVEFRSRHAVDDPFQLVDGEELPTGIDEKTAIGEGRLVLDEGAGEDAEGALLASSFVPPDQLAESLETVPRPEVTLCRDPGFQILSLKHEFQLVRLVGVQVQSSATCVTGAHVDGERVDTGSAFGIRYFYQTLDVPLTQKRKDRFTWKKTD